MTATTTTCECGCGETPKPGNRFIYRHNCLPGAGNYLELGTPNPRLDKALFALSH